MAELTNYTVVADAITVTQRINRDGKPEVVRMEHGETLRAPADHRSVLEFLAMGGIVKEDEARETFIELTEKTSRHRPTAQRRVAAAGGAEVVHKPYRITGYGVALTMSEHGYEAPEAPMEEVVPIDAPDPVLAPTE